MCCHCSHKEADRSMHDRGTKKINKEVFSEKKCGYEEGTRCELSSSESVKEQKVA